MEMERMKSIEKDKVYERASELEDIEELINACGEGSGLAQQEARLKLERIGEPAVEALCEALLHSHNSVVRMRAAEALGHIGDARAIEPLLSALLDGDSAVQWRAIEALADIGNPAIESLKIAAESENEELRWGANRALKDIKIKIILNEQSKYDKTGRIMRKSTIT
jgi:bilin biosynthesis protein